MIHTRSLLLIALTTLSTFRLASSAKVAASIRKCGIASISNAERSASDRPEETSRPGEFPWTVEVLDSNDGRYLCVGSLIHPQVVLTAVQCIDGDGQVKMRAGVWNRGNSSESPQDRLPATIVRHPQWRGYSYNMALVILGEPFTLGTSVNTICLPPINHITPIGTKCPATTWGNKLLSQEVILKMQRMTLSVLDIQDCIKAYADKLDASVLCVKGDETLEAYTGDSGAPMVCPKAIVNGLTQYHQIGFGSFSYPGNMERPEGYGNVAHLRSWIDETLKARGLDISAYEA